MLDRSESKLASPRTKIAEQYIKQIDPNKINSAQGWKRTLARELSNRYPDLGGIEPWRDAIRRVTRSFGSDSRRTTTRFAANLEIEIQSKEDLSWQTPFIIPSGITEMVVFGDIHGCYMDKLAIETMLEETKGIKTAYINGDLLDNTWLSRWAKDKDAPMLKEEFRVIRQLLEAFRKQYDTVYFKSGNHDNWLSRKLAEESSRYPKEVSDKIEEQVTLEAFLGFSELGIKTVHGLQECRFGDLSILHGHEKAGAGSPMNLAQNVLTWWQRYSKQFDVKVLVNHHHWRDQTVKVSFDEKIGKAWTNGCLCDVRPKYSPYGRHNTGYAIATQKNGVADVTLFEA